ncbi:MAG: fatty acid desaturase [Myxococcales bacterium]|nr:fatty acid desaturase [Myxococcales bacterium]
MNIATNRRSGRLDPAAQNAETVACMAALIEITDPVFVPMVHRGPLDRFLLHFIREERDLPIAKLLLSMAVVLWPLVTLLYSLSEPPWGIYVAYYFVLFGLFFDRFILALHNISHRPLFKPQYRWLTRIIVWTVGPLAGETPEAYFVHHIGMHHAEGNLPDDLSTTMKYRRDSIRGFLHYWANFFLFIHPNLIRYLIRRKRWRLVKRLIVGELGWLFAVLTLARVNLISTMVVLVVPMILARFLMMAGNWAQHAFVDPADPGNDRRSSIVCINTRYNRRCFNDGYHIGHHERPNLHWSEMPRDFMQKREKYANDDAVIFEGIDYFQVWGLLMLKQYKYLASCFVDLRDEPRSRAEIVALLKSRTLPIH